MFKDLASVGSKTRLEYTGIYSKTVKINNKEYALIKHICLEDSFVLKKHIEPIESFKNILLEKGDLLKFTAGVIQKRKEIFSLKHSKPIFVEYQYDINQIKQVKKLNYSLERDRKSAVCPNCGQKRIHQKVTINAFEKKTVIRCKNCGYINEFHNITPTEAAEILGITEDA